MTPGLIRVISFLAVFTLAAGPAKGQSNRRQETGPVQVIPEVTLEQARALANRHFGRPPEAGCFTEGRGPCWFVAPPFLSQEETETKGVYVLRRTGKLYPFYPIDPQFLGTASPLVDPDSNIKAISPAQAAAIANQYFGIPPEAKHYLESRGSCWFATSTFSDPADSETQGVYIHKLTGKPCPFFPVDARYFHWETGASRVLLSADQAKAMVYKHLGRKPFDCFVPREQMRRREFRVDDHGRYWDVSRNRPSIKRLRPSFYVDKHTGELLDSLPHHSKGGGKKKGR